MHQLNRPFGRFVFFHIYFGLTLFISVSFFIFVSFSVSFSFSIFTSLPSSLSLSLKTSSSHCFQVRKQEDKVFLHMIARLPINKDIRIDILFDYMLMQVPV